jgi:cell division septation protein DedD
VKDLTHFMRRKNRRKKPDDQATESARYRFDLSRKELFLWVGVAFFALVWMFTLGVIVGRGLSPVRFDVEKLRKELIALKEEALRKETASDKAATESPVDESHLGFYDVLTEKKEEARHRSFPSAEKEAVKVPVQEAPVEAPAESPRAETAVAKTELPPPEDVPTVKPGQKDAYTLQVASLQDRAKAENLVAALKKKGYGAYAVTTEVTGKGTYHRVRVGHFTDRDEAIKMATKLKGEKYEPIVLRE